MSGHAVSSNEGRSNPAGRAAGLAEYWNFQTPFSDRNHGESSLAPFRASSAVGYTIIVAWGGSVPRWSTEGSSHSSRASVDQAAPENVVPKNGVNGLPGSFLSASTTVSAVNCAPAGEVCVRSAKKYSRATRSAPALSYWRATASLRSSMGTPAASATVRVHAA